MLFDIYFHIIYNLENLIAYSFSTYDTIKFVAEFFLNNTAKPVAWDFSEKELDFLNFLYRRFN